MLEQEQTENMRKVIRIKALLKEEEPQKLIRVIDKLEGSQGVIDRYVARITGVNAKVISTTRMWHRILKKIVIEEGKEVLDMALGELEQELCIAKELKKKNEHEKIEQETKAAEERKREEDKRNAEEADNQKRREKEIRLEEGKREGQETEKRKEEDLANSGKKKTEVYELNNIDSVIEQEIKYILKRESLKKKTAIEILFNPEPSSENRKAQEDQVQSTSLEDLEQQDLIMDSAMEEAVEDLSLIIEDEILEDTEDVPLGTSQKEINDPKEYWRKQIDHAVATYKEPRGSSLEASTWAPNVNTCEDKGHYKAKVFASTLPGDTKEERVKFVKGTLPKNNHISKIEEQFIKGNAWITISLDCQKGFNLLKERINKKNVEWYRVIFEETESSLDNLEKAKTHKPNMPYNKNKVSSTENRKEDTDLRRIRQNRNSGSPRPSITNESKGKNKDFIWVTLWDLPLGYSNQEIKRLVKNFGSAEEIRTQRRNYYQVAEVKIFINSEEQERKIKTNWVLGLENGKLTRLTLGMINAEDLKEREGFRAILTNIPSSALETLLLRSLQATGAKAVYIPYNSNRNPCRIAKVFFKTKEDRDRAVNRNIYYFNTKLFWKENLSDPNRTLIQSKNQDFTSMRRRSRSPRKKEESMVQHTHTEKENPQEKGEMRTQREGNIAGSHQIYNSESISFALNRVLNRLEALEGKWETTQRPRERRIPNRS
jgi:hypothetical protein